MSMFNCRRVTQEIETPAQPLSQFLPLLRVEVSVVRLHLAMAHEERLGITSDPWACLSLIVLSETLEVLNLKHPWLNILNHSTWGFDDFEPQTYIWSQLILSAARYIRYVLMAYVRLSPNGSTQGRLLTSLGKKWTVASHQWRISDSSFSRNLSKFQISTYRFYI